MAEHDIDEVDPGAIAIVGMAAHLPGARTAQEYWRNLCAGVESVRFWSDEELLEAGESRSNLRHPRYVKASAPLPDMELFDAEFFGFSPKEAAILDPQHRHFLECAWEALESAGHPPSKFEGPIGVFGGCGMGSYFYFNLCTHPDLIDSVGMFLLRHTGNDKDFLTTRVSHVLDLTGPAINVQTACSTSLVAVHLAVQSLISRECDMALAGGVTIELPHRRGYHFKEGEILSPDGHCHAFDHRAQGTVFGSGAGVVVLRRLEDALADGDHIHAVIRSTAINNDGASKAGYLAPSVSGQAACIVEAHALGGIAPDSIGYVECHGTGTYLGDPIEVSALTEAFRQGTEATGFCRIGSAKTNIGHLDTAAGVASLIKAASIVEHGVIPPSLNYDAPNPTIDFESTPFVVNTALHEWSGPSPRRAGVQSLGVGGTNAHVVVEEPPVAQSGPSARPLHLFTLSARNKKALDGSAERLGDFLAQSEAHPADVANTLRIGRHDFDRRAITVAANNASAATQLQTRDRFRYFTHEVVQDPTVVFLFPGGGAQYVDMGKELYETEPTFRKIMDDGFAYLASRVDFDLKELLYGDSDRDAAAEALLAIHAQLPATWLSTYAMARLLEERGVTPDAMLGHSMGEYAAACLAGVFDFEEALGLVLERARLMSEREEGLMLAVGISEAALRPYLHGPAGDADLAAVNAPSHVVASGAPEVIAALEKRLAADDIDSRRVPIDRAAHSRMFDPAVEPLRQYIAKMNLRPPTKPFVSSRTGTWITPEQATDPSYWSGHLRNTVRFGDALATLLETPGRVFIEVGPGKSLGSFAKQAGADNQTVLSSYRHAEEEVGADAFLLELVGRLWATGVSIDVDSFYEGERRKRVVLPTYAFQRQHYFIEPGTAATQPEAGLEKIEDVRDWGWVPRWIPRAVTPPESEARQSWLVFMDDAGVGTRVVQKLRDAGHTCTLVNPGDTFAERGGDYVLSPERGREGYDQLVRALVAKDRVPTRVLHLWLTTADESFRPGSSFFHRNQERGFYSLLFLAQAIADENLPRPMHVQVVTDGMQRVGEESLPYPEKATSLGPSLVIGRELPGVTVGTLDVRLPEASERLFGGRLAMALVDPFAGKKAVRAQLDEVAEAVFDECVGEPTDRVAAVRPSTGAKPGKRFERDFQRTALSPVAQTPTILRAGGAYLITGGLGGLGLVAAHELARAGGNLVLLSRRGLPPRDTWDAHLEREGEADATSRQITRVRELEALGAEVRVAAADVTNLEQMRGVVESTRAELGPIRGVVHTAGTVRDELIQVKNLASIGEVFAAKIHGTLILDALFGDDPDCDFLLLYSSTSTAIAPAGQVDYVAANAFLDAYAQSRSRKSPRTMALHWGIWTGVGMAAEAFQQTDLSASPDQLPATSHPLYDGRLRDALGQLHLVGELAPANDWILDQHRLLDRTALVPGTGYLEMAAEALAELGEFQSASESRFEIRDLLFLRPLVVGDDENRRFRVKMRRSEEGYAMEVRSACSVEGRAAWQLHAQATVSLVGVPEPRDVDLDAIRARCSEHEEDAAGIRSPQEEHLAFGPRWRVLTRADYGQDEALGELALPTEFAGDLEDGWLLHPAVMDLATGFAMKLIDGYQPTHLWVPVSYESVRVYRALPRQIRSWVRSAKANASGDDFALFDVTLADLSGRVLVDIRRFAIRRMNTRPGDTSFLATLKAPSRNEVEFAEIDPRTSADSERTLSPGEQRLQRNLERGIQPSEGADALRRVLAEPRTEIFVSSLDLPGLVAQASQSAASTASTSGAKFARPDLDSDYVEPKDDVERALVGFWEELLGVDQVGTEDSFFDLGGHSLIAVRLFAMVKKTFQVEFPISVLFEAPTIAACAALVREARGDVEEESPADAPPKETKTRRRYTHLVSMHAGEGGRRTPFFLVAGMFGNVLNLRHLANLIGTDRPFYGLQAKGLYGDEAPHETFEEMAEAYLAEIRTVQPRGPYLLGGFSGGGYTALEMGRQLRAAGEEVPLVVLLDTPAQLVPEALTLRDRATIQAKRFETQGVSYLARWARDRAEWELGKIRARFEDDESLQETEFHNEAIEAAFRRALDRYDIPRWDRLVLFRPPLDEAYVLGPGRILNSEREYVYDDNGWGHYADVVEVHQVPGDHDSMVLEPNVRVMATKLRSIIDDAGA